MLTAVVCRARNSAWCTGSAVCICSHVVYAPHLPPSTRTQEQALGFTCGCIAPHLSTTPGPQRAVTDSPWEMKRAGKTLTGLRDTPWGAPSSGWWRSPWQRAGPRSRGHEPPREEVQACGEGRETLSLAAGRARLFLFSNEPSSPLPHSVTEPWGLHRPWGLQIGSCRAPAAQRAGRELESEQEEEEEGEEREWGGVRGGQGEERRGRQEREIPAVGLAAWGSPALSWATRTHILPSLDLTEQSAHQMGRWRKG